MDASPLARLPGELRNEIWRYTVVEADAAITIENNTKVAPILATCREIRQESWSIYFAENNFEIAFDDGDFSSFPAAWFGCIGIEATNSIHRLRLRRVPGARSSRSLSGDYDYWLGLLRDLPSAKNLFDQQTHALLVIVETVGLRWDAVQMLGPEEKKNCWDAECSLMKGVLDDKLLRLMGAPDEGAEASESELAEEEEGEDAAWESDASDDELADLSTNVLFDCASTEQED